MAKRGPAPLIDERRFIPETLEDAKALTRALIQDAQVSRSQAGGIVMFLIHLDELERNEYFYVRSSQYRRFLARLGAPPWEREPTRAKGAYNSSRRSKTGLTGRFHRRKKAGQPAALLELEAA